MTEARRGAAPDRRGDGACLWWQCRSLSLTIQVAAST